MKVALSPTAFLRQAARRLVLLLSLLAIMLPVTGHSSGHSATAQADSASSSKTKTTAKNPAKARKKARTRKRRASRAVRRARTARIKRAFVASTELRPMAQQLATLRTPAAYAGVTQWAHEHTGEAAAAAYLALGHAYLAGQALRGGDRQLSPGAEGRRGAGRLCGLSRGTRQPRCGQRGSGRGAVARLLRALSGQHLRRPGSGVGGQRIAGDEGRGRGRARAGRSRRYRRRGPPRLPARGGAGGVHAGETSRRRRRPSSYCCWAILSARRRRWRGQD